MRLNKWIADSGLCSRREADRLIESGQVTVNGKRVDTLGVQIRPEQDEVRVSGHPLPRLYKHYLLFHKPKGYITTRSDEKGRRTIYDLIPPEYHNTDPAGRLDRDSTGLLILSNDGDFIHQLTHPSFHWNKVYRVRVQEPFQSKDLDTLVSGVLLEPEGKLAQVKSIEVEDPFTAKLTLVTGMNRQVRRSLEALGYTVASLKRLSFGPIRLGDLKPGAIRPLAPRERQMLKPKAATSSASARGSKRPRRPAGSPPSSPPPKKR
jgi:pseudouridine synthase